LLINGPHGITNYNSGYSASNTNHLSGGYFGAPKAMLELTRSGYTKKAYELLMNTNFPCWLYSVINGFTTCWESWDTYLAGPNYPGKSDRGYYPNTLVSFNHLPFGAVAEWVWKVIGGINPDDNNPGFKNVIIRVEPGGGITNAFASFNSIHGPTVTCWTNNPGTSNFVLNVTVPANATASIFLPSTNLTGITEAGIAVTNALGVGPYYFTNWPNWSGGATVFQAGSGTYSFSVNGAGF
jgi:alpha-L-rhamnosidase